MIRSFKLGFIGLTEQNAPFLAMTPPPASREPPQGGSLLPKPAEIRYPISDFAPRPKAPSPRGLRPQAVGEFTAIGIFTPSNRPTNPDLNITSPLPPSRREIFSKNFSIPPNRPSFPVTYWVYGTERRGRGRPHKESISKGDL